VDGLVRHYRFCADVNPVIAPPGQQFYRHRNNPSRLLRPAQKCEPPMTPLIVTCLTILGHLALTTSPVLIPAIISAGHAILSPIAEILAGRVQGRAVVDVTH
jgi:hypothetical protein